MGPWPSPKRDAIYERAFGWTIKPSGTPDQPYTEFEIDGLAFAGAAEINPMVPDTMPNYWIVYFRTTAGTASWAIVRR